MLDLDQTAAGILLMGDPAGDIISGERTLLAGLRINRMESAEVAFYDRSVLVEIPVRSGQVDLVDVDDLHVDLVAGSIGRASGDGVDLERKVVAVFLHHVDGKVLRIDDIRIDTVARTGDPVDNGILGRNNDFRITGFGAEDRHVDGHLEPVIGIQDVFGKHDLVVHFPFSLIDRNAVLDPFDLPRNNELDIRLTGITFLPAHRIGKERRAGHLLFLVNQLVFQRQERRIVACLVIGLRQVIRHGAVDFTRLASGTQHGIEDGVFEVDTDVFVIQHRRPDFGIGVFSRTFVKFNRRNDPDIIVHLDGDAFQADLNGLRGQVAGPIGGQLGLGGHVEIGHFVLMQDGLVVLRRKSLLDGRLFQVDQGQPARDILFGKVGDKENDAILSAREEIVEVFPDKRTGTDRKVDGPASGIWILRDISSVGDFGSRGVCIEVVVNGSHSVFLGRARDCGFGPRLGTDQLEGEIPRLACLAETIVMGAGSQNKRCRNISKYLFHTHLIL